MMNRWLAILTLPLTLLAACDARVIDEDERTYELALEGACDRWGTMNVCGTATEQYCDWDAVGASLEWAQCVPEEAVECVPDACVGDDYCGLEDGVPTLIEGGCVLEPEVEGDTPLVLVLQGQRAQMSASAASFDISGVGRCLQTDWPAADTPWLAIDLDGNGDIEGPELFGSGSVLRSGDRARHGFMALAELDTDADGAITSADERFGELLLWSDHDGDRRSTAWELTPLSSVVDSISLDYRREPQCDDRGNCAVERSAATTTDGVVAQVVDLHLACQ